MLQNFKPLEITSISNSLYQIRQMIKWNLSFFSYQQCSLIKKTFTWLTFMTNKALVTFFLLKKTVSHINCNRITIKDIPHVGLCLFRRHQVNLLVCRPDRPYSKQKLKIIFDQLAFSFNLLFSAFWNKNKTENITNLYI